MRELKSMLKQNKKVVMCDFSVSAALALLRDFLLSLPQPLLEREQWNWLSQELNTVEDMKRFPALEERCREQMKQLSPHAQNFLQHVLIVIRQTATENRRISPDPDRLLELLMFLGPAILRSQDVTDNQQLSQGEISALKFLTSRIYNIFGEQIFSLFPNRSSIGIPNSYEVRQYSMVEDWLRFLLGQSLQNLQLQFGPPYQDYEEERASPRRT